MGGTWEEMGGNGRSNSRSTRGEIAVFDPKTPLLSIMDMNVTRNLHKTYIFVSFLPDSPPFPPVLSRTFPDPSGLPLDPYRRPRRNIREHPGWPCHPILHMGAPGRNREEPGVSCSAHGSTWENPAGSLGGPCVPGRYPVGRIVTQGAPGRKGGVPGRVRRER